MQVSESGYDESSGMVQLVKARTRAYAKQMAENLIADDPTIQTEVISDNPFCYIAKTLEDGGVETYVIFCPAAKWTTDDEGWLHVSIPDKEISKDK